MLFEEGLSCYRMADPNNPLLQKLEKVEGSPLGSSQMVKNLLEIFLIKLHRHKEALPKENRLNVEINGIDANKGEAMAQLCKHLGISPEEVLACGDGSNDATMIRRAGIDLSHKKVLIFGTGGTSKTAEAVARHYGLEVKFRAGSTDCNIPLSMGIPAVCVGCVRGGGAHTREEYVEVDSLLPGIKVAFDMILSHF